VQGNQSCKAPPASDDQVAPAAVPRRATAQLIGPNNVDLATIGRGGMQRHVLAGSIHQALLAVVITGRPLSAGIRASW
jgi:hypothetical protein